MAISTQVVTRVALGHKRMVIANVTFDSSYQAGGEPVNLSDLGMRDVECILTDGAEGWSVRYNKATKALVVYGATPGTEVTSATNLSTLDVTIAFIGL